MDALSSFFFTLEKSVARTKQMVCLRLPDGTLTTDQRELRMHAVDFYDTLYSAEDCSKECQDCHNTFRNQLPVLNTPVIQVTQATWL